MDTYCSVCLALSICPSAKILPIGPEELTSAEWNEDVRNVPCLAFTSTDFYICDYQAGCLRKKGKSFSVMLGVPFVEDENDGDQGPDLES